MGFLCQADLEGSSDSSPKQGDSRAYVLHSVALSPKVPPTFLKPFFPLSLSAPDPASLTSEPAQKEVLVSIGQSGQQVLEVVPELRGRYNGQRGSQPHPDPSQTQSVSQSCPGALQGGDHRGSNSCLDLSATWERSTPQPTMTGRVGSFSNFGSSLPPQDPHSIGLRWGPAFPILTKIPVKRLQASENNLGTPPLILRLEGLDLKASYLTTLSLFPHLYSGEKGELVPITGVCTGKALSGSPGLQQVSEKCGHSANVDCLELWTVELSWKQPQAEVNSKERQEKPGMPQQTPSRLGKERGRPPDRGFCLLVEFGEAAESWVWDWSSGLGQRGSLTSMGTKGAEGKPWRGGFAGEPANGTLGLEVHGSKAIGSYLDSPPPNLLLALRLMFKIRMCSGHLGGSVG